MPSEKHSNPLMSSDPEIVCDDPLAEVICSLATPSCGSRCVVASLVSTRISVNVVLRDQLPCHQPSSGVVRCPGPPDVPDEVPPPLSHPARARTPKMAKNWLRRILLSFSSSIRGLARKVSRTTPVKPYLRPMLPTNLGSEQSRFALITKVHSLLY